MGNMDKFFEDDRVYTAEDIAKKLNISKRTVYSWARTGKLKAIRIGGNVRFLGRDLNKAIQYTPEEEEEG